MQDKNNLILLSADLLGHVTASASDSRESRPFHQGAKKKKKKNEVNKKCFYLILFHFVSSFG